MKVQNKSIKYYLYKKKNISFHQLYNSHEISQRRSQRISKKTSHRIFFNVYKTHLEKSSKFLIWHQGLNTFCIQKGFKGTLWLRSVFTVYFRLNLKAGCRIFNKIFYKCVLTIRVKLNKDADIFCLCDVTEGISIWRYEIRFFNKSLSWKILRKIGCLEMCTSAEKLHNFIWNINNTIRG